MKALKSVFFDFGGTIDRYPVVREKALEAVGSMISILNKSSVNLSKEYTVEEFYKRLIEGLKQYKEWRSKTLIELPSETVWKEYILSDEPDMAALDANTAEELTFLIETGRFTRSVRPEMKTVMDELTKTGLHFGIISNVLSLTQVPRNLVDYGLESYFSTVVMSSEFGKSKPDPSIFLHAAKKAGFLPSECLYVGNSPQKDIFGAKNAGFMGAVQIEYVEDRDDIKDPGIAPDYFIKSMRELPDIVYSYSDFRQGLFQG